MPVKNQFRDLYSLMDLADKYSPNWKSHVTKRQREIALYLLEHKENEFLNQGFISRELGITKQTVKCHLMSLTGNLKKIITSSQKERATHGYIKILLKLIPFVYKDIDNFIKLYKKIETEYLIETNSIKVKDLALSTKLKNILLQNSLETVGDIYINYNSLMRLNGFGIESLTEIEISCRYGYPRVIDTTHFKKLS